MGPIFEAIPFFLFAAVVFADTKANRQHRDGFTLYAKFRRIAGVAAALFCTTIIMANSLRNDQLSDPELYNHLPI